VVHDEIAMGCPRLFGYELSFVEVEGEPFSRFTLVRQKVLAHTRVDRLDDWRLGRRSIAETLVQPSKVPAD
jgi:hypothetical protein